MIIAPHHIKGTPQHDLSAKIRPAPEYTPVCAWPDDCMVQWGHGIIPANPFFEAFPKGMFIRGDGETIEAAERQAFAQFTKERSCDHIWGRRRRDGVVYLNGGAWCRTCKAWRSGMFPQVVVLGHWRKPLERWEHEHLIDTEENAEGMNEYMDAKYPQDAASRKRYARQLRLRMNLFGASEGAWS